MTVYVALQSETS